MFFRAGHRLWQLRVGSRRNKPGALSSWARKAAQPSSKVQLYLSETNDPYLNLSIEHYLLEQAPADSAILFLYTNRPCVVIGRNQNPWLEVKLNSLDREPERQAGNAEPTSLGKVELVRRRSGGGTVFHDEGNVNWAVISPSGDFTRDKHAEMVVRALRNCGVERARVNPRHDIVLDQGPRRSEVDQSNLHLTPFTAEDAALPSTVKVSGSAYKLTRGRALHHATCLLTSPNLHVIPHYLHAPAKPFIKAKGVESVSSPVDNIGLGRDEFYASVREEFAKLYNHNIKSTIDEAIGEDALEVEDIRKGWEELQTPEWMFDQTPQFTFSNDVDSERSPLQRRLQHHLPPSFRISLDIRHGQITNSSLSMSSDPNRAGVEAQRFQELVHGRRLREDWRWRDLLSQIEFDEDSSEVQRVIEWLETFLPTQLGRLSRQNQNV